MLFERLHTLASPASRLLLYPAKFSLSDPSPESLLLQKARSEYNAILQPIDPLHQRGADLTWSESYTKLLAFNQTQYTRLLHLDSDSTLLQPMDELFLLPSVPAAMPRSYWEDQPKLSSAVLLLEPSAHEFARIERAIAAAGLTEYDMEILNKLYKDTALILPHKSHLLYTREFTSQRDTGDNHERYLGDESAQWDPDVALKMAKYVHFSDWPLPKPWLNADETAINKVKPPCEVDSATGQETNCRNQEIWLDLYDDFKHRRKEVCGFDPL